MSKHQDQTPDLYNNPDAEINCPGCGREHLQWTTTQEHAYTTILGTNRRIDYDQTRWVCTNPKCGYTFEVETGRHRAITQAINQVYTQELQNQGMTKKEIERFKITYRKLYRKTQNPKHYDPSLHSWLMEI